MTLNSGIMIKIISVYILLAAVSLPSLSGQEFNRPVPAGFPKYEFRQFSSNPTESNYLQSPFYPTANSPIRYASVMDQNGYLKWYLGDGQEILTNFEFHPEHNVFSYASLSDFTTYLWKFYVTDLSMNIIDSVVPDGDPVADTHEFRVLDNGNYLIVGAVNTYEDLTGYTFDGATSGLISVRSFAIQEFENGNLIFDWKSIDHIHPAEYIDGYNYNPSDFDYAHGNAVEEDSDGNFLVSFRALDAIYKIDRVSGEVIWILGGRSNQFDFVNDDGFSGQHDVRVLDNGNVTLFDNGNQKPEPRLSRAVEYDLNFTEMTATRVWQYIDPHETYASATGSFRVNPDHHRIIGLGYCNRPTANFIHLNEQGQTVAELLFQDSVTSYRATRHAFTLSIDQPEITCFQNGFETTLSADDGYDEYVWNTGDTTQMISVVDTGVYQVWVNVENGMIGSLPYSLSNLSDPCGVGTGIEFSHDQAHDLIKQRGSLVEFLIGGDLKVFNSIGQMIIQKSVGGTSFIDLSNQPKGIYVLDLRTEGSNRFVKRVLNH